MSLERKDPKRPTAPSPKLPLCMEAEINPAVAAIKQARERPLKDCEPPPRHGNFIWEDHPSPEVREAWRPIPGEPYEERIERVQRAYQAWYQRLYAEGNTRLVMDAVHAAYEKCSTDEEFIPIVRSILAPCTRDPVAAVVRQKRSKGGARTAAEQKRKAAERDANLAAAAKKELRINPGLTDSDLARRLADKELGGAEAIRKKLKRLLPGRSAKK